MFEFVHSQNHESAHVRIDEFAKKSEEYKINEPRDYKRFVYYEPYTLPNPSMSQTSLAPKLLKSLS